MSETKELRIDCAHQTKEELALAKQQSQTLFKLNHTMPMTPEYDELVHELFPTIGENSVVNAPLSGTRFHMVRIGNRVIVMNGCLMMSAGGITIDDDVQIAANVQLITNNHDLNNRAIITCRPIHICRRSWIGAGATILPGITVGENSVVGAGSVVTKNVPPNVIVVGNPAKIVKSIDPPDTTQQS